MRVNIDVEGVDIALRVNDFENSVSFGERAGYINRLREGAINGGDKGGDISAIDLDIDITIGSETGAI